MRGEVLSGPLGSGAAPAPAPLPDRAVQAARQSRSETDSPFTLPNVVWELALILLLVGGGWWFERQNASSSRTVHHLR